MNLTQVYYSFPSLYQLPYLIPPELVWRHKAVQAISEHVHVPHELNTKILEIGCGSGFLSRKLAKSLPNATICAIDSSNAMITHASRNSAQTNLRFLSLDYFGIPGSPLGVEKFDVVVSLNAWCFFALEPSIEMLRKICKRGTRFIAVTYSGTLWSKIHSWILSSLLKEPLYLHEPIEFMKALGNHGFEAKYNLVDSIEGSYLVRAVFKE